MILAGELYPLQKLLVTPCAGATLDLFGIKKRQPRGNPPSLGKPSPLAFASPVHSSQAASGAGVLPAALQEEIPPAGRALPLGTPQDAGRPSLPPTPSACH